MTAYNVGGGPGIDAKISSTPETPIWWGHENLRVFDPMPALKSTTVDAGSTPTTNLRAGLVLGKVTATGLWTNYSATATDGSQVARGVLYSGISMLNQGSQVAEQKQLYILIRGLLKASAIISLTATMRSQLASQFMFDDDFPGYSALPGGWRQEVQKAADYTVVAADSGTEFVAITGAVVFTLPTLAAGLRFKFRNQVDANMTIASAAGDDMIADNDAAADSVAFSTSGHKLGGGMIVYANQAGDKWVTQNASASPANVVTVAT